MASQRAVAVAVVALLVAVIPALVPQHNPAMQKRQIDRFLLKSIPCEKFF